MAEIFQNDLSSVLAGLPAWDSEPHDTFSADVLITAVGFEDRMPVLLKRWLASSGQKKRCILICYTTNSEDNMVNLKECRRLLDAAGIPYVEVKYQQNTLAVRVSEQVGKANSEVGVLVDISSMASFVFFPLFRALVDILEQKHLWIGYVEAEDYFPTVDEWQDFQQNLAEKDLVEKARYFDDQYFQSKGGDTIFECVAFVGCNPSQLPVKIVMVPNFSFHRIFNMREYAQRSYAGGRKETKWIVGTPPDREKNGWRTDAVYKLCNCPKNVVYCCTFNYKDMISKLQSMWEACYLEKSMCIAYMGSKAQHFGTFLFLLMHPEVALLLSEPREFVANRYSKGVGKQWFLDCGDPTEMTKRLRLWNCLSFSWT
jgi:hypothetical protein